MLEDENSIIKTNIQNYNDKNNNILEIQNIYEKLKLLNLKLDKREDDIKNIINEKDLIIEKMNQKLKEQEKIINVNNDKINTLNKQLNDINKQIDYFKNFEIKIKKFLNYEEIQSESIKKINNINNEISIIKNKFNTFENENVNSEDINNNGEDSSENENIFYDEYEEYDEDNIIVNKLKKHKKNKNKKKENIKEEKDNFLSNKNEKKTQDEEFILIGKDIPKYEINLKEKIFSFQSEIVKSEEQLYLLQKSIQFYLPNIKLNAINFDLVAKLIKFPLNIKKLNENEDLLLNKNILLIAETIDNNIICLCFNKSYLPNKSFYLFLNDNKIFYYKKKRKDEKIQKNEIYRDEEYHTRYKYNKETIKNIGELKNYFFEGYFRFVNNMELANCKIIEIFQILYE